MGSFLKPTRLAAIMLIISVVTQILYLALEASGTGLATILWHIEAIVFALLAIAGAALVPQRGPVGGGLLACGIFNVVQVGMGLTLFEPLGAADGFPAILGLAFFLYFAAKAALGVATMWLGAELWHQVGGAWRMAGGLGVLTGLAAAMVNFAAMGSGMTLLMLAGGLGTAAAALCAAMLWRAPIAPL